MSKDAFDRVATQLKRAIQELFTIEVMASLTRPTTKPDTDRQLFKDWVNEMVAALRC